jgi:hypothetical protein
VHDYFLFSRDSAQLTIMAKNQTIKMTHVPCSSCVTSQGMSTEEKLIFSLPQLLIHWGIFFFSVMLGAAWVCPARYPAPPATAFPPNPNESGRHSEVFPSPASDCQAGQYAQADYLK